MAVLPVYRTWTAGEVVTAAYFNSNVRDAGNFFLAVPTFEGRQTVAQSLTSGSVTAITFDTNDLDSDGGHSIVSNTTRYVGKTMGRFQASGSVGYAANANGRRLTSWSKNAGVLNSSQSSWMPITTAAIGTDQPAKLITVFLNGTTDYIELNALQESGGALNTNNAGAAQAGMSVRWIGTT